MYIIHNSLKSAMMEVDFTYLLRTACNSKLHPVLVPKSKMYHERGTTESLKNLINTTGNFVATPTINIHQYILSMAPSQCYVLLSVLVILWFYHHLLSKALLIHIHIPCFNHLHCNFPTQLMFVVFKSSITFWVRRQPSIVDKAQRQFTEVVEDILLNGSIIANVGTYF